MDLNLTTLFDLAEEFAYNESHVDHPEVLGVTDGKALGTYVEHRFEYFLRSKVSDIQIGNSARGIDIPDHRVNCDIKVTSIRQPQSSCPYKDSRQKIYDLGYNLLLFVYEKNDSNGKSYIDFKHVALIESKRTADYTLTSLLRAMLEYGANKEDIAGLLSDKALPGDDITLNQLADEILQRKPHQGYLTISNALQWRLQYSRIVTLENQVSGVMNYDR